MNYALAKSLINAQAGSYTEKQVHEAMEWVGKEVDLKWAEHRATKTHATHVEAMKLEILLEELDSKALGFHAG